MIGLPDDNILSDALRDRLRFHAVLQALEEANAYLGRPGMSVYDIDQVLDRLLPNIATALRAEQAFVAIVRAGSNNDRWFEVTVTYPQDGPRGARIQWSPWLEQLVEKGIPLEHVPLDPASARPIRELDPIRTVSALVVRMDGLTATRIVGLCGSSDPEAEVFLAEDLKTFRSIIELLAVGWRVGQKRSHELESIQRSLAVVSAELNPDRVFALIVEQAVKLFDGAPVSLMLWDRLARDILRIVRTDGLSTHYQEHVSIPRSSVEAFRGADGNYAPRVIDLLAAPLAAAELVRQEGLCWALACPLQTPAGLIGVLNIYSKNLAHTFSSADVSLAQIVAHQVAIAIHNAQLYHDSRQRAQHLQALHNSSLTLAEGIALDRKALLQRIAEQAVESLTDINPPKAKFGVIRLMNADRTALCFECVHPPERWKDILACAGECRSLNPAHTPDGRIGVGGRAVRTGKAQLVLDIAQDLDYVPAASDTRSELDVPLMKGDRAIGVLSVESDELAAFDENDQAVLEGLAAMAVVVHRNSELTDQLARNTAVASMGAWGAEITHDTGRPLQHLRMGIGKLLDCKNWSAEVTKELVALQQNAEDLAALDLDWRPLEECGPTCSLRDVIEDEVAEARSANPQIAWSISVQEDAILRIGPQWGRRLLRHLLKNALQHGPKDMTSAKIGVRAHVENGAAHIRVINNGPQVPEHERDRLFLVPLAGEDGRYRRGLVVVSFVAERYGGGARLVQSDESETCFEFCIPVADGSQDAAA